MAKALAIDWDTVRSQFLSGASCRDISLTFGVSYDTIRKRASREGWRESAVIVDDKIKRAAQVAIAQTVAQQVKEAKPEIDAEVKRWVEASRYTAKRIVGKIGTALDATLEPDELQKLAGALNTADVVGRRSLGMDGTGPTSNAPSGIVGLQVISSGGKTTVQVAMGQGSNGNCLPVDYASGSSPLDVECQPVTES